MQKPYKGIIFFSNKKEMACLICGKDGGCLLTKETVSCVWCYKNQTLAECFTCAGFKPALPIYWLCGWHYYLRTELCPTFVPNDSVFKELEDNLAKDARFQHITKDKSFFDKFKEELKSSIIKELTTEVEN